MRGGGGARKLGHSLTRAVERGGPDDAPTRGQRQGAFDGEAGRDALSRAVGGGSGRCGRDREVGREGRGKEKEKAVHYFDGGAPTRGLCVLAVFATRHPGEAAGPFDCGDNDARVFGPDERHGRHRKHDAVRQLLVCLLVSH